MASNTATWTDRFSPDRQTLLLGGTILNVEIALLWLWVLVTDPQFTSLLGVRFMLYPLIWINVGLLAIWKTTPPPSTVRRRYVALVIATVYFGVLSYAGGLVGPASSFDIAPYLEFGALYPGMAPALLYDGAVIKLSVFPYKLIGYLALAYLVYVTVLDAAGSVVSGVLGLLSCVSCTWPVAASLLTGVLGGGSAIAGAAFGYAYDLSVVVFVVTVGLLYWRPSIR